MGRWKAWAKSGSEQVWAQLRQWRESTLNGLDRLLTLYGVTGVLSGHAPGPRGYWTRSVKQQRQQAMTSETDHSKLSARSGKRAFNAITLHHFFCFLGDRSENIQPRQA